MGDSGLVLKLAIARYADWLDGYCRKKKIMVDSKVFSLRNGKGEVVVLENEEICKRNRLGWWEYTELNFGNISLRFLLNIQVDMLGGELVLRVWS